MVGAAGGVVVVPEREAIARRLTAWFAAGRWGRVLPGMQFVVPPTCARRATEEHERHEWHVRVLDRKRTGGEFWTYAGDGCCGHDSCDWRRPDATWLVDLDDEVTRYALLGLVRVAWGDAHRVAVGVADPYGPNECSVVATFSLDGMSEVSEVFSGSTEVAALVAALEAAS